MAKRKTQAVPTSGPPAPRGPELYLLDRFDDLELYTWRRESEKVDELVQRFYFYTESDRVRLRTQIKDALNVKPAPVFEFENWYRIVTMRWMLSPLSACGSLMDI